MYMSAHRVQNEVLDPLELKLQMNMCHNVDAGNQNSSPLQKQQVLTTAEKSLQSNFIILTNLLFACYNDYKLTLSMVSSNSQE